jgi:hypothetical protein
MVQSPAEVVRPVSSAPMLAPAGLPMARVAEAAAMPVVTV